MPGARSHVAASRGLVNAVISQTETSHCNLVAESLCDCAIEFANLMRARRLIVTDDADLLGKQAMRLGVLGDVEAASPQHGNSIFVGGWGAVRLA